MFVHIINSATGKKLRIRKEKDEESQILLYEVLQVGWKIWSPEWTHNFFVYD